MSNPVTFSSDDYTLPQWSAPPQYKFHFQVIKDGDILKTMPIKQKQFHLIGRLQDLCDIFIDNPTVSRKHAILQFKNGQSCPYIFDIGGTHGTLVNRNKLPSKVYQQIKPYDTIKFGISSRSFILRCPNLQKQQEEEQQRNDNQFLNIIAQKNKALSKKELKQKYMNMLQNDPYYKANNQPRKLLGKQDREIDGVDWGIRDQYEIYAYKNENQFAIQPDIVRRLPNLDQNQLNKITEFQGNLRRYEQIQGQLNQLANKERREFGLEEKQRDKKDKLQRKFVQAVQALEKSEDWIRAHIFGEQQVVQKKKKRVKEEDTFENDEYLDRTLGQKNKIPDIKVIDEVKEDMITTVDYWKLNKQFKDKLKQLKDLIQSNLEEKGEQHKNEQKQQEDQLDAYMNENNMNLDEQNASIYKKLRAQLEKELDQMKLQLLNIMTQNDLKKIQNSIFNKSGQAQLSEEDIKNKHKKENFHKISSVLQKLQKIREEQNQADEEDIKIFEYYEREKQQIDKYEKQIGKRKRPEKQQKQVEETFEKPIVKFPKEKIVRDLQAQDENEYFDLTKLK